MTGKMKAQVFYEPHDMRLEEREVPTIEADEVLLRVKACGICGSDVAYYEGLSPLETESGKGPLVLGHEFTGEVVEVGLFPKRKGLLKPGDRVVVNPVQYCGACEVCNRGMVNLCENKTACGVSQDGAFAEYVKAHYTKVFKLPDNVSYEEGSLTEPLACATYGVNNLQVPRGGFCVVIGPGPIGLMMVQMIKSSGAGRLVLVGTRDYRLELGGELGADVLINTADKNSPYYSHDLKEEISKLSDGRMADRVITSTGSVKAMEQALDISGRKSIVVFFGLPGEKDYVRVPALESIFWDKTIRFSWLAPLTWPQALQAISTGIVDVKPLITHRFKLDQLVEALSFVSERKDNVIKGVVIP